MKLVDIQYSAKFAAQLTWALGVHKTSSFTDL